MNRDCRILEVDKTGTREIPGSFALYVRVNYSRRFKTGLKILWEIALSEKVCQYDLPKKVGDSYRTILRHLKTLKELRFIELDSTEPSSKGGKEKNIWRITFPGLLRLLMEGENLRHIDELATKYAKHLPLIFGKWPFFKQKDIKDQIKERIQKSSSTIESQIERILLIVDQEERQKNIDESENLIRDIDLSRIGADPQGFLQALRDFDSDFLKISGDSEEARATAKREITNSLLGVVLLEPLRTSKELAEYLSYLSVLKKDPELHRYVTEEVKRICSELENKYTRKLRLLRLWESQWAKL